MSRRDEDAAFAVVMFLAGVATTLVILLLAELVGSW